MSALDLYGNIALLVGGPQPDATNHPDWWSGAGGITGIVGCFLWPSVIVHPVTGATVAGVFGIVEPGQVSLKRGVPQANHVRIPLWILAQTTSGNPTAWSTVAPYEDLVPAAFEGKMQLDPAGAVTITPAVLEGFPTGAEPIGTLSRPPLVIAGSSFIGWRFTIDADRTSVRTYSP